MGAHVAWSVADKSTCNALVRSLIILHLLLKQSQSYDGILSHRDVILSQIPPIEVAAFVLYFATKLAHIANFVQMALVHMLMPIINTSLQKGCTSYYMPEISKNEIAILKYNHGSLTR